MNEEKTTDIITINATEFGLTETKAKELAAAFKPMLDKMVELETEFNAVVEMDTSESKCMAAKTLKNKYVKVRTGSAAIHKEQKAFYFKAGRAVDGWKNAQLLASHGIEEKLDAIANHYENIEKARIAKVEESRIAELSEQGQEVYPQNLGEMPVDVWDNYILGARVTKKAVDDAAKQAELDRIKKEKEEEKERNRVRLENIELKKEADAKKIKEEKDEKERQRVAKIEADKQAEKDAEHKREMDKLEADRLALKKQADADKAEKDAESARSKDKANKTRIQREIFDYIITITDDASAKKIATAIIRNNVPNVSVKY